jgi:hypothetical protein
MILRTNGQQYVACECGEELEAFDPDDFGFMIADAKREGWQVALEGGEWVHRCPTCKQAPETPLQRAQRLFSK